MKLIRVDFKNVDEDGLVLSRTDQANVSVFKYDMVLAHNGDTSFMGQVVALHGDRVKIAIDPAHNRELDLIPA